MKAAWGFYFACVLISAGFSESGSTFDQKLELNQLLHPDRVMEINAVSDDLYRRFPPEKFILIGIGRSPFPVLVPLERRFPSGYIHYLPLASGLMTGPLRRHRRPEYTREIFEHFQRYLPTARHLRGKRVAVIDWVSSGYGLKQASSVVNEFYAGKAKVIAVELQHLMHLETRPTDSVFRLDWQRVELPFELGDLISWSAYSDYAPYGQWKVGELSPQELRPEFLEFKAEFFKRLGAMSECNKVLSNEESYF